MTSIERPYVAVARRIGELVDARGESPWMDIAGYGVLGVFRVEQDRALAVVRDRLMMDGDGPL